MKKIYILPENPVPMARPRFYGNGPNSKVFNPQKNLKLVTAMYINQQHDNQPLLVGPLQLDITFYMQIPKTRQKLIKDNQHHISKPDIDNLIKWICDLCTGVVYHDDAIISVINSKKIYHSQPRTEFYFTQLKG